MAYLSCSSPVFWNAVGHAIDPARVASRSARRLIKAARYIAGKTATAPTLRTVRDALDDDPTMEQSLHVAVMALIDEMQRSQPDLPCTLALAQSLIDTAIREELYEIYRFP